MTVAEPSLRRQHLRAQFLTALALGASLGAAYLIIQVRAAPAAMGDVVSLPDWPISWRLPQGWTLRNDNAKSEPCGGRIAVSGPTGETLVVAYDRLWARSSPFGAARDFADDFLDGAILEPDRISTRRIGPLLALEEVLAAPTPGGSRSLAIASASIPSRMGIVVAMLHKGSPASLFRTLRGVSESVTISPDELVPADAAPPQGPWRCPTPPGMLRVAPKPGPSARAVFIAAADAAGPSSIEVWRTLLHAPRTPSELVLDRMRQDLDGASPQPTARTVRVDALDVAMAERVSGAIWATAWCVAMDDDDAVMLYAEGLAADRDAIESACRFVIAGVAVAEPHPAGPAAAAVDHGRRNIAELRRLGPARLWIDRADTRWWLIERCDEPAGYSVLKWLSAETSAREDEAFAFEGTDRQALRLSRFSRYTAQTDWALAADGLSSRTTVHRILKLQAHQKRVDCTISREPGAADVSVDARIDGRPVMRTISVSEHWLPEPLHDDLILRTATLAPGQGLCFQHVDYYSGTPANVFCWPIGSAEGSEIRVAVQFDFRSEITLYEADETGRLARLVGDDDTVWTPSNQLRARRAWPWQDDD